MPAIAGIVAMLLTIALAGCAKEPPEDQLPPGDKPPEIDLLQFTAADEGWPPQVRGIRDVRPVAWEAIPGALGDELEAEMLAGLLQDSEVVAALGDRFAHVATDEIEGEKPDRVSPGYRFEFFSHSNNATIRVEIRGSKREAIQRIEPSVYQPHAGAEELALAITAGRKALAERDFAVQDLVGSGILAYPGDDAGEPRFYDSRILYVTFAENEDAVPLFFALVNLTEEKIIDSGPVAGSRQ